MAASCGQILSEARALVTKLHDREKSCSTMLSQTQQLSERIKSMAEYKEDLEALNNLNPKPRSALVHSLQQENRQIRLLQEENRQLKLTLEEHQAALELIMRKYRQQMVKTSSLEAMQCAAQTALSSIKINQGTVEKDIESQLEFVAKFEACLRMGEEASHKDQEEIARLQSENKLLRQLISIASANDPHPSEIYSQILRQNKLDLETRNLDEKCLEEQMTPKADLSPEGDVASCSDTPSFAQASATLPPCEKPKKSAKKITPAVKTNGNNNEISSDSKKGALNSKENSADSTKKGNTKVVTNKKGVVNGNKSTSNKPAPSRPPASKVNGVKS